MEENAKIHKVFKCCILVGSIIVLFSVIFIELWAAYYSVFNADDFSIANSMRPYGNTIPEYIMACFRYIKRTYLNWQGTYSSFFIWTILNPLNELGLPQLRVIMVLNGLLYFSSLFFLIFIVFNFLMEGNYHIKLFFCACVAYMIMNSRMYPQVFFWFNGAATYCFPIFCLFFSVSFFILSNIKSERRILYTVLTVLFSIGSQGGSLAIPGAGCYIVLIICFLFWLRTKKLSTTNLVALAFFFIEALINAVSPGNFIRHTQYEEGIHPITAIGLTFREYFRELKLIVANDQFCVILLMLILCGAVLYIKILYIKPESDIKLYTLMSLLLLITPMGTIFPIILGYGGNFDIPNRALFIINTIMVLTYSNLAIIAGCWITIWMKKIRKNILFVECPLIILLLIFLVRIFIISDLRDTVMIRTLRNLYHGRIQAYYEECKGVYEYLRESDEMDIVIENYPQPVEGFGVFELYPNPNEWVNTCVAKYYYKNSVRTLD